MKNIICFGDSNTFGYCAEPAGGRYELEERWPGILHEKMGDCVHVVEAGANGRTLFQDDPQFEGSFGILELKRLLLEHPAADFLIVMLGTNDLKTRYHLCPNDIARGMEELILAAKAQNPSMGILLISPVLLESKALEVFSSKPFDRNSCLNSRLLAPLFRQIAQKHHCLFLDAALVASAGEDDGTHLDKKGHRDLAVAVYGVLASV